MTSSPEIFVCYRRTDLASADRLKDALHSDFGIRHVFFDRTHLEYGDEWIKRIDDAIAGCRIFLVVIGRHWESDRLHNSDDMVAHEISSALRSGVRVIPVLVGASLPARHQLPERVSDLLSKHAFPISDDRWREDYALLSGAIGPHVLSLKQKWRRGAAITFAGLLAVVATAFVTRNQHVVRPSAVRSMQPANAQPAPIDVPRNVRAAMGPLTGIDFRPGPINWQALEALDVDFAYVAASPMSPADFRRTWRELQQHHVRRGAYFFFRANSDPVAQADRFAAMVELAPDDLPPAVDIEEPSLRDGTFSRQEVGNRLRTCLRRVEEKMHRQPVVYTVYHFWHRDYGDFSAYPLWFFRVGNRASVDQLPGTWTTYAFWQAKIEHEVPGMGPIDIDYFKGNARDLEAFVAASKR